MNEPTIKQAFIVKNIYNNSIFIWVSTSDGHNWVNENCNKFGEMYKDSKERDRYNLYVSQLYEFDEVYKFICQELGYVKLE